ncbi:MAG: RNA polymerase sigma factor [Bacteroidales bacterium]|nr:RNA polymerase sigma factor [Bacteroidales bacterium]MCI1733590.1 RNA polymerase sigma factor [Bacteroidales bacterium]
MSNTADIEKIYNSHSRRLYFTSLRILGNSFDAEDVMQDTVIEYYKHPRKEEISNIGGWLQSVCVRKSVDLLRKKEKENKYRDSVKEDIKTDERLQESEKDVSLHLPEGEEDGDGKVSKLVGKIKKILLSLPGSSRMVVSLHLFEGYDYEEIAQITGLTESGIRSQFMRGRNKIAEELNKDINIKQL